MSEPNLKIAYEVVDLDDVIRYFVRGYEKAGEIENLEWYVDAAKGKVVLKLYVRATPESGKP